MILGHGFISFQRALVGLWTSRMVPGRCCPIMPMMLFSTPLIYLGSSAVVMYLCDLTKAANGATQTHLSRKK